LPATPSSAPSTEVEQLPLFVEIKPSANRRKKPGPKPKRTSGSRHEKRPDLKGSFPVHVVLRVHRDMGSLRKRFMYSALREATIADAMRELAFNEHGALSRQFSDTVRLCGCLRSWALSLDSVVLTRMRQTASRLRRSSTRASPSQSGRMAASEARPG
jgi:hypothetical protein